mmetsp:Transcript_25370/g.69776  ORF Transcript_25370/g.69776 Transcript_25370/m.69776 type:complete len:311 (+) Transcript_25370:898-1830(+)
MLVDDGAAQHPLRDPGAQGVLKGGAAFARGAAIGPLLEAEALEAPIVLEVLAESILVSLGADVLEDDCPGAAARHALLLALALEGILQGLENRKDCQRFADIEKSDMRGCLLGRLLAGPLALHGRFFGRSFWRKELCGQLGLRAEARALLQLLGLELQELLVVGAPKGGREHLAQGTAGAAQVEIPEAFGERHCSRILLRLLGSGLPRAPEGAVGWADCEDRAERRVAGVPPFHAPSNQVLALLGLRPIDALYQPVKLRYGVFAADRANLGLRARCRRCLRLAAPGGQCRPATGGEGAPRRRPADPAQCQ